MKTGDRVICIDAGKNSGLGPPLIKGREYIIYDTKKCSCGLNFDVGLSSIDLLSIYCVACHGPIQINTNIFWAHSSRFAKVKQEYRVVHMDIAIEEPSLN